MEKEPDRVEVIDFFGEEFNKRSVPCSVVLLIMLSAVIVNLFLMFLFPDTYISLFVSILIIGGFVSYYSYILRQDPGKIRKFSISVENIEIILPNIPFFRIGWSEFESLEIRMSQFNYKPYYQYELHFMNRDSDKVVRLSLSDFHKVKVDQILVLLKNFSKIMKKEFAAVKETNISGIIQVENFKI